MQASDQKVLQNSVEPDLPPQPSRLVLRGSHSHTSILHLMPIILNIVTTAHKALDFTLKMMQLKLTIAQSYNKCHSTLYKLLIKHLKHNGMIINSKL